MTGRAPEQSLNIRGTKRRELCRLFYLDGQMTALRPVTKEGSLRVFRWIMEKARNVPRKTLSELFVCIDVKLG
jgi:hypothetical protein